MRERPIGGVWAVPAVSVIIPIYNVEKYVGQCIASVKNQTFVDFEAICVNDGCTDNSIAVAQRVVGTDERFSFVSQANAGLSAARNAGMKQARGKYIIFLDSDDYWRVDALELLYERMEAGSLDVLYFSAQSVYENLSIRGVYREEHANRSNLNSIMNGPDFLIAAKKEGTFQESAVMQMLRRSLLEESGISFYEGILHEDNLFTCMVLAYARRVTFLNEPLYYRLIRGGSIMTTQDERNAYGRYKCASEIEKWVALNACNYNPEFIEALLSHAALCYQFAAEGAEELGVEAMRVFAEGLDPRDRWSFWMDVVERGCMIERVRGEYANSTSYRIGNAITAAPRWVKDRFG